MSNLVKIENGVAALANDDWTLVKLPEAQTEERIQAGKVVLFKLTGESTITEEQIANTVIPATGKIIVPLSVFVERNAELESRIANGEVGVWLATHELLEYLIQQQADLNVLPIIAVFVERFADGRIFSIGTLLRTRYGFKNELRAFGDVLRDQLFFLKRSGFTSFMVRQDRSAQEAIASLNDFSKPYQGAVDEPQPVFKRYNRGV
ncbi:MAG: hypothetical protein B7Y16_07195 [Methylotenera sp. 24-45-7]|jgi:uncharacterized protein (DUF934 family)|nr:MAG: hypothetical protein B7Y72_03255 [Mehylophilales bacterium 35-46-6]OYZ40077.1 MAG: hypothetical protein B7Y16_07195 [Methylotenera sp. 24-45-7]OZA08306.1 MAG: hypothetical protein B7X97_06760 [Methylotenera sp. 17-45-7]OZA48604.1 MAG: hypothetical protein B7X73_07410 [Methylophilales bacterium 39-45-7]HQS38232.1 DUF934 domain-containing protein [Methylotenera sp.]